MGRENTTPGPQGGTPVPDTIASSGTLSEVSYGGAHSGGNHGLHIDSPLVVVLIVTVGLE